MFKRSNRVAAFAFAIAFIHCATAATAVADTRLERWRSYAGVSWEISKDGRDPAPFAGSVNAPIAGLHFDARGAAYVSTPRFVAASTPATLSRLDTRSTTGPARLTPFPSMKGNAISTAPGEHLRNVLGFYVDRGNDWLWALDMGFVAGESEAPAGAQKIVVFDLKSGRIVKRIGLDGVADRAGSFLNDIVVDERRRIAYVSDSGSRSAPDNKVGLIVADFASGTARRVLDRHPGLQVEAGVKVVAHGVEVWPGKPLSIGINGIALSPDGATLYWTVTTGTRARSVPTAVLRRHGSTDAQIAAEIHDLGAVGGNTDGIVMDSRGVLYMTDVTHNGIVKYEPRTKSMSLIASDDGVHWPDTPAIHPNGDLIFTSSALSDHVAGIVERGSERYDLWRIGAATPVRPGSTSACGEASPIY
ncbi:L-dopachrome tautomerase-related protein [Burkholderia sp. Bp9031]|uniref:L-dopachrome tautomerase-related protein n=1 Tax=Burkholderia sp. Bp9031 TaxID=2184566 RepID=UPI0021AB0F61|nr:L-dopachrome tautomerase-related protein [Burkholderia sp. Bp9031]